MRRVAIILGLFALLLPAAAWANGIDLTNQYGTVTITNAGITSVGSELMSYGKFTATHGHSLGSVSFSTGSLATGSIWGGGTFNGGGTFLVLGVGKWAKHLTGATANPVTLFSGSFVGPVIWTVVRLGTFDYVFTLSGTIQGTYWDGRTVNGTTTQTIFAYKNQWFHDRKGGISLGKSNLTVPEPGTLGLLGTGLIFVAGSLRRKLLGA